jgi:hypothetical protein
MPSVSALASINGGDSQSINGGDLLSINGGDSQSINGGDLLSINGGDLLSINGGDSQSINGGDLLSINGGDLLSINGGDSQSINGGDRLSINGGDSQSINGGDRLSINGGDLLVVGTVDVVGDGFISVLGQSVFADQSALAGINVGSPVAIYGSIDSNLGGIVNATVVGVAASDQSFLRGTVDEVNVILGRAVISGVAVDYTAMLSNRKAPRVGEVLSVRGRTYSGTKLLVVEE